MAVSEEPSGLTTTEVVRYLLKKGGRSTNHELVHQFKKFLNDPLRQVEARLEFKDIVNTVATVWEEQGVKYIMLRKKYQDSAGVLDDEGPSSYSSSSSIGQVNAPSEYVSPFSQSFQPYWRYRLASDRKLETPAALTGCRRLSQDSSENSPPLSVIHARSSPNLTETSGCDKIRHTEVLEEPIYENTSSLLYQNYAANAANLLRTRARSTQELLSNSTGLNVPPYFSGSDNSFPSADTDSPLHGVSQSHFAPHRSVPSQKTENLPIANSLSRESQQPRQPPPYEVHQNYRLQQLNVQRNVHNSSISVLTSEGDQPQLPMRRNQSAPETTALDHACDSTEIISSSETPAPPPRHKDSSGKENRKLEFEKRLKKTDDPAKESPKDAELHQLNLSSGKVKERVQKLDQLSSECNGKLNVSSPVIIRSRKRDRNEKGYEDDASIASVDPKLRRQWFLKASKCDYHSLVSLLKEEPKLADIKDMASGFTALHWAAKHGNADVVKLIAGTHKINPNIRSHGGYTAIHIATLYKHKSVVDLLIKAYGADPTIRDHSGKRADQYPDGYVNRIAGVNRPAATPTKRFEIPLNNKKIYVRPLEKEPSGTFIRIGSLNLKVARTSGVFASVRSSTRLKTWSSSDSVSDLWSGNNSTSRTSPLKKKRSKKNAETPQKNVTNNHHDSDSDSAYGFHS